MKKSEKNVVKLLNYIIKFKNANGYQPTIREMCKELGVNSTSTVHYYLKKLESRNIIKRDSTKNRAIKITNDNDNLKEISSGSDIPLFGNIAAGSPIIAEENIYNRFSFSNNLFSGDDIFMLTVKGESMIDAGIMDGDFIVVKKQNTALNGDIVVALIDDSATVKTFYKESSCIRLQPENPLYEPIIVKDVKILGKVIGVIRKY